MKKLTHIIKIGAFALLTSLSVAACIDGNDWETISGNRLFGTTSFSVEPAAITAEAKWDATPNTEYYIIEASREQMDDNMPMGSASGSIVYGEDQSIKKSPYTLAGLLGETTYYLRIKSVASGKESRWIYLEDGTFETSKEEILGTIPSENITEETILITWEAGLEVTHFIIKAGIDAPITKEITSEEVAAGQKLIEGLLPGTEYTFSIYNGEIKRGETTAMTVMPEMVDFTSVTPTKTSVSLVWDPEAIQTGSTTVSHYAWCEGDRTPSVSDHYTALTVEQISQGQLNFDGLEPSTTYTVALMRGTYVRALTTFTTAKGIPSGYTRVVVTNKEEWNTAISSNTGKVAMLIPSGTTLDITSATAIIPNTITSLLIWGADESEEKAAIQPDIRLKGLSFADGGGYETIEFYNLYLHHDNNENNFVVYHQNNNATIQNLILESCKVDKIRGIFRFKNATGSCSNCIINNCLIENIGSYGLFATAEAKGTWTFDNVVLTNSTINESGIDLSQKGPLLKTQQDHSISFEINQCTIYGLAYTIINSGSKPLTLNISNTLFGGFQSGQTVKGYEEGTTVNSSENVYTASDSPFHSNALGECLTITSAELFNAPAAANGDFTVKIDTYKTYGDQRWNK